MKISGFRAARDVVLEDLGQVNLFVGPNGSGKTSLLSAAYLFCIDGDASQMLGMVPPETDEIDAEGVERALSWMFYRDASEGARAKHYDHRGRHVSVSGQIQGQSRTVTVQSAEPTPGLVRQEKGGVDRPLSRAIKNQDVPQDLQALRDSARTVFQLTTKHGKEKSEGRLFISMAHGVFGESQRRKPRIAASLIRPSLIRARSESHEMARLLDDALALGTKTRVEKLLREVDPDVRQLLIGVGPNGTPVVRVEHDRLGHCPLNILGDGMSAVLHFALRVNAAEYNCVMFDEFDASLHVSVLRYLAKFVKNCEGVQLFLATHRADTVGAFVELVEEGWHGLRVFQTRLENGEIQVQGFGGQKLLTIWRDLALDIRVPA